MSKILAQTVGGMRKTTMMFNGPLDHNRSTGMNSNERQTSPMLRTRTEHVGGR